MDYKDYLSGKSESNFWFRAKRDLITDLLEKNYPRHSEKLKILSIGVGTGDELEILNKFGEVYIIDIEKKALELIPNKFYKKKMVCDACNIKYKDNFFDLVVSFDVFEHIKDDKKAISEVHRVLKQKGTLIFSVPAFQFLYGPHDRALNHKRRYSKNKIKKRLERFEQISLDYWNFFLFLPLAIMRILKKNSTPKVENPNLNPLIGALLYKILKLENFLIRKNFKTPFGITIVGVYKNKKD
jgi:ubiquinone/menaquinone biosynthesis C-methylase UbiE